MRSSVGVRGYEDKDDIEAELHQHPSTESAECDCDWQAATNFYSARASMVYIGGRHTELLRVGVHRAM